MITDATLAALHHLLAFGLVGLLMAEWALLRADISAAAVRLLSRIDMVYGLVAMTLIVVGVLRVIYGAKGATYYMQSTAFWIKMALFAATGVLSIRPTMALIKWRRTVAQTNALPGVPQWSTMRKIVVLELHALAGVMIFAALMARGLL